MARQTSKMGVAFLEREEGVVLKAYRDPAGVLTIGPGLTRASGVIDPKPGMTISAAESERLTALALQRNYEPRVEAAMPAANQHEFDGAISFDWNTGAIHRASWVKAWQARDWVEVLRRLQLWNKGGGKVLPGLARRREREFRLMREGVYGGAAAQRRERGARTAMIALELGHGEMAAVRAGLTRLGYDPGSEPGEVSIDAVRAFQKDHDLTVDGILGRATLSTLQRRLDARVRAAAPAAVGTGGAAGTGAGDVTALPDWAGPALLALAALWALWLAWRYRDVVAAKIDGNLPRLAAWLRRF